MSRRRRVFIVMTTIGAFIVGFIFAWNVFNPTSSGADTDPVEVESAPTQGEVAAARNGAPKTEDDLDPEAVDPHTGSGRSGTVDGDVDGLAAEPQVLDSECDDLSGRYVGLHDDRVAVFSGTPDGCHRLLEVRSPSVLHIPPFQIDDLRRGIVFHDDDELFQILEGLNAP